MLILYNAIILNLIQLISSDCGIPGVSAFARIVNFNPEKTNYPEGYVVKYDCTEPHGFNLNGELERVCTKNEWTPYEIPICDIADPDDNKSEFEMEIFDLRNNSIQKDNFRNNWSLFGSQDKYVSSLRNNFIFNMTKNETNLWRIKFENKYPVEMDHSFLVIMVFVIPFNSNLNSSEINIEINSRFTSTQRTCRTKTEIDSIYQLFSEFNTTSNLANNTWDRDIFHKILIECRNDWLNRRFRWQRTSDLEYLTGLNLTIRTDSVSPIELILTQLTVDVDCGYPDIPLNANYTKSWMNTIYSCNSGQFRGQRNISCKYSGGWVKPTTDMLPKCCVADECDIKESISPIVVIIILLSSAVVGLGLLVIALIIRSKRKRKFQNSERQKNINNGYDDIDLNGDETYDHLQQPNYEDINYDEVNCYQLDMYDNCEDNHNKRLSMTAIKAVDGEYVQMDKCDNFLTIASKHNSNSSINCRYSERL